MIGKRSLPKRYRYLMLTLVLLVLGGSVLAACGDADTGLPTGVTTSGAQSGAAVDIAKTSTPENATSSAATSTTDETANTWSPRDVSASLTGSGASFPDPLYQAWIAAYKGVVPGVTINYQSVGSGQGKRDFISQVTDFGGTDAFMTDTELEQSPGALHIPTVLGAVTVNYNLPEVPAATAMQFSGETVADIFLGTITVWNDPAIAADNPGIDLPDTPITVVHRSDGSGTTAIFTDYLSKVSSAWADAVGAGTAVEWPVGIGAEKNPGVMAAVKQTPGAIGYAELIYALANDIPSAALKNAAGNYVAPSIESTTAAAAGFLQDLPADLRISITNPQDGAQAYPAAGFTWLLVHRDMQDMTKAQALADFIYWCLTEGSEFATSLHYAPLPEEVRALAVAQLMQMTVGGQPVFQTPK